MFKFVNYFFFFYSVFCFLTFSQEISIQQTHPTLSCLFYSGTDYPSCTSCDNPVSVYVIDFGLNNTASANNSCGLTYFNPSQIRSTQFTSLRLTDLITLDPGHSNNITRAQIQVFSGILPFYIVSISSTVVTSAYLECTIGNSITCSPYHSPFTFPDLNDTQTILASAFYSAGPTADCKCYLLAPTVSYSGVDSNNNTCNYRNITTTISPLIGVMGCLSDTVLTRQVRTGAIFPIVSSPSNTSIDCTITSTSSEDYLLLSRTFSGTSTAIISWNDEVIYEFQYSTTIATYMLPSEVSAVGGLVNVIVTYPDFTWSTCSVIVEGLDPCLNPNISLFDSPWSCLSSAAKCFYVFFYLLCSAIIMLVIIVLAYFLVQCMMYLLGCYLGIKKFKHTKAGNYLSSGVAKVAGAFAVMDEAEALSTDGYEVGVITLNTLILTVMILSLLLALVILLFKFIKNKRNVTAIYHTISQDEKNKDSPSSVLNKAINAAKKSATSKSYVKSFLFFGMLGMAFCCNTNFFIQSGSNSCTNYGNFQNCSISTTVQIPFTGVGSCASIYNSDPSHPYGLDISLIHSGYVINLKTIYYSQLLQCVGQTVTNCDAPDNDAAITQCQDFNSYGTTCTSVNDGATGFPANTGFTFTRCQCTTFSTDADCTGFALTMGKQWSYNHLSTLPQNDTWPVYQSTSLQPFYYFAVSVTDSNPMTYPCLVTPTNVYCSAPGIQAYVVSNFNTLSSSSYYNFFKFYGSWYYAENAQPLGEPSSCLLGNVQFGSTGNNGNGQGNWYKNFCSTQFSSQTDTVTVDQCSHSINDYGVVLPTTIPGLGTAQYINDVSGFSGLVVLDPLSTQVTMDFSFSGNFTFQINNTAVCPNVVTTSSIVGCYSCGTPASFSLTAFSSCLPGIAFVKCNYPILNPSVFLDVVSDTFILNFYSTSPEVSLSCSISATTVTDFETETLDPLSPQLVSLNQTGMSYGNNNSTWTHKFNNNQLQPESYFTFTILIIVSILFLCLGVCVCFFASYCFCKCLI